MSNIDFTYSVEAARRGETDAFEFLYNQSVQVFRASLYPMLKNEYDIEDVLQEAYIAIFKNLERLEDPKAFIGWGKTICRNVALHHIRTAQRHWGQDDFRPPISDDEYEGMDTLSVADERGDYADPQVQMDAAETKRLLDEMIGDLPEMQRLCIVLWQEGLTTAEIAERLAIPKGTVNSNVNYAKKKIKDKVLLLEKQGTKLYGLAPIPFFLWIMRQFGQQGAQALPAMDHAAAFSGIMQKMASTSGSAQGGSATGTAASAGRAAAAGAAKISTGKLVAIVAAACVAVGAVSFVAVGAAATSGGGNGLFQNIGNLLGINGEDGEAENGGADDSEETDAGMQDSETSPEDAEGAENTEGAEDSAATQTEAKYLLTAEKSYTGSGNVLYSTTYYTYDENGCLISKTNLYENTSDFTTTASRTDYENDSAGNPVRETESYSYEGSTEYEYTYDESGNVLTETALYNNLARDLETWETTRVTSEYSYDSDGNCLTKYETTEYSYLEGEVSEQFTRYSYDEYGNLTEEATYFSPDDAEPYNVQSYTNTCDSDGKLTAREYYQGELLCTQEYSYNENGQQVQLITTQHVTGGDWVSTTTYEYDEHGNLISTSLESSHGTGTPEYRRTVYEYERWGGSEESFSPELSDTQKDRIWYLLYPLCVNLYYGYEEYDSADAENFWNLMFDELNYFYWAFDDTGDDFLASIYTDAQVEEVAGALFADFETLPDVPGSLSDVITYYENIGVYEIEGMDPPYLDFTILSWDKNGDGSYTLYAAMDSAEANFVITLVPDNAAGTEDAWFYYAVSSVERTAD
ncbi:MAG: sigma-70 family RNA polymerase sigma factor [Lachnospiraceae bacterium]|nr:sigma-70 family RNA polymerase sigma factor [Lachnospiraceae bacterium]